jgi:hypothetical protein
MPATYQCQTRKTLGTSVGPRQQDHERPNRLGLAIRAARVAGAPLAGFPKATSQLARIRKTTSVQRGGTARGQREPSWIVILWD